jgi:hypothetical protein
MMNHLNYFIALVVVGAFFLLMGVSQFIFFLPESAKIGMNILITIVWAIVLIGLWIRYKGLAPKIIKPRRKSLSVLGHLSIIAGHVLIFCIVFIKAFAYMMILPVLGVLVFYGVGVLLIEISRGRAAVKSQ